MPGSCRQIPHRSWDNGGALRPLTCLVTPSFRVREMPTLPWEMSASLGHGQGGGQGIGTPVCPDQLVGVRLQKKAPKRVLHAGSDVALGDAPDPGVHDQRLPTRHVVQQSIKLGAVADPLPHLEAGAWGEAVVGGGPSRFLRVSLSGAATMLHFVRDTVGPWPAWGRPGHTPRPTPRGQMGPEPRWPQCVGEAGARTDRRDNACGCVTTCTGALGPSSSPSDCSGVHLWHLGGGWHLVGWCVEPRPHVAAPSPGFLAAGNGLGSLGSVSGFQTRGPSLLTSWGL